MKKSVLNAAMLLALGVSGAANAVQMHGVIEGTLTSFTDIGADKAWLTLAVNDSVRFDFWLDSNIDPNHVYKDNSFNTFRKDSDPAIRVKATINGVSHQINSEKRWELVGDKKINNNPYGFILDVDEWKSPYEGKWRNFQLDLSFSDGSSPILKNLLLGHAVRLDAAALASKLASGPDFFAYQGQVAGKTYNSIVYYAPTSLSIAPVPEPETWAMMLLGLGVVGYAARRRAAR